jgi:hypothetical protein
MRIIEKATLDPSFDVAKLEQLLAMKERWEATEARKAYNAAFAAFKAEAIQVVKNKTVSDGPLKGKSYAELFSVVNAVTPLLSKHGLSHSWKVNGEKDMIRVTCTLTHVLGHAESVSIDGPPDTGGAKNAIQARASTITYLERYTLKAVCGIAEQGDDIDGGAGGGLDEDDYVSSLGRSTSAKDEAELKPNTRPRTRRRKPWAIRAPSRSSASTRTRAKRRSGCEDHRLPARLGRVEAGARRPRHGVPHADVTAKIKTGEAAARRDYRAQIVAEILTGLPQDAATSTPKCSGASTRSPRAPGLRGLHRHAGRHRGAGHASDHRARRRFA